MREDAGNKPSEADEMLSIDKDRLERLQRGASVGAVASSVAHEFNNILTSILNHAKAGLRTSDSEVKQRSFDKILASARRAAKVTTGMLALSRNRSARRESTDLVHLVDEVLAVLEKDLAKHQVRLERRNEGAPVAEVVASQIEQVLLNLVINARQAMPTGGTLEIVVASNRQTKMAEIAIKDTGGGIEPEILNRIFDPYYSTKDGPDQSGQGGSGLGLSVCREIVERHQGRIRVESLVGRGTTFIVKLPIGARSGSTQAA